MSGVLLPRILIIASALIVLTLGLLGVKYWFSVPFRGICLASVCYAAGFALSLASQ